MRQATLSVIGVPCDAGAGTFGAAMGPDALRVAGLIEGLEALGCTLIDQGNLSGPKKLRPVEQAGLRNLAEVIQWCETTRDAVLSALSIPSMPVVLGGDHSLAMGSIAALAQYCQQTGKNLHVLWLDAHTDFNTELTTPSGNLHGMPLSCLCGYGPPALTGLAGFAPILSPAQITQVGIRSVDAAEKRFVHEQGIEIYDMRRIDELGMPAVMRSILSKLDANTHLHVSLDVDFLDPDIAPGVGTAVLGGPTYREAQLCMEMIAESGCLGSLDIVELNPAYDIRNQTAKLIVDLVESLLGKSTLIRRA
ncbi:arginase [Uliginosibacterium sediminicola]|uniref:Arginase n=1 Tax=Uliginosibacterium sediminicola TaxID=2024550 RepID=A0ABU9YV32_9RHOO